MERRKSVDKTEKDQLKECFVQNVTQCYNTYITGKKERRGLRNVYIQLQFHVPLCRVF